MKVELMKSDPMSELTHDEQLLLMLLLEQAEPTGARNAHRLLLDAGRSLSEASVSRMLLRLDELGLTRSIGKKGRTLTPHGKVLIRERARQLENTKNFQRALELRSVDEILDWLRARKLLEGDVAYLAALRLDEEAIDHLQRKVHEHEVSIRRGTLVQDGVGMNFHRELAAAIESPVFLALIETLSSTRLESVEETLDTIVINRGTADDSLREHNEILTAVKNRNPEVARAVMYQHFERLENDVRLYSNTEFMKNLFAGERNN